MMGSCGGSRSVVRDRLSVQIRGLMMPSSSRLQCSIVNNLRVRWRALVARHDIQERAVDREWEIAFEFDESKLPEKAPGPSVATTAFLPGFDSTDSLIPPVWM
jgi:hypothetical protein